MDLKHALAAVWRAAGQDWVADALSVCREPRSVPARPLEPSLEAELDQTLKAPKASPALRTVLDLVAENHRGWLWRSRDEFMPDTFKNAYAFVEMAGPDCPWPTDEIRMGFYLQRGHRHYPPHWHQAEEFYILLSGWADWSIDRKEPFRPTPGEAIHHPSNMAHAMTTHDRPILTTWAWRGDLDMGSYRIDGGDQDPR